MKPVRVLIVDDSPLARQLLREILANDARIEVVGHAVDAEMARERIKQLNPDVITLDVEMPGTDGISFLRRLMRLRPMPVLMVSSLTERGASVTLEALALGAVDFVTKPRSDLAERFLSYREEIVGKILAAAEARVRPFSGEAGGAAAASEENTPAPAAGAEVELVAIGASTGGTEAIRELLEGLAGGIAPIMVVQHIPPEFSSAFARRLDRSTPLEVREAADGASLEPGRVYVAPGGRHLEVARQGCGLVARLGDGARVNQHRPSVDVLFESVAKTVGRHGLGILLTGMGCDGAEGLLSMNERGATTVAQDEQTSVIWGMPRAAVLRGAADHVLPLRSIRGLISTLGGAAARGRSGQPAGAR